jgi:membrane dipeptidase
MVLDMSHLNHETMRDTLMFLRREQLSLPLMISHGGCYAVHPSEQGIPDDVMAGILRRGGIVCISTNTRLLHDSRRDMRLFLEHLSHVLMGFKDSLVGIGGDGSYECFHGYAPDMGIDPVRRIAPLFTGSGQPAGLNSPNRMHQIAEALGDEWDAETCRRVLGTNLIEFMEQHLS